MTNFSYGVDIGFYQRFYNLNFNEWADNGIDFVILKGDEEPTTQEMWERLARSRIPVKGMYFWHYPLWNTAAQVAKYSAAIAKYNPDFIGLDIENWWVDYDEYEASLKGKIKPSDVRRVDSAVINKSARDVYKGIQNNFPHKYFLRYTAEWVVVGFCPDLNSWLNDGPNWIAMYPDTKLGVRKMSWAELKQYPPANVTPTYNKNDPNEAKGYKKFSADRCDMWQCSSRIVIPNEPANMDINVFFGDLADLQKKCGLAAGGGEEPNEIVPVVIQPVETPAAVLYKVKVTASFLTVVKQPDRNSEKVDWLTGGTVVEISEENSDGFGFFKDGQGVNGKCSGWIKLSYTQKV